MVNGVIIPAAGQGKRMNSEINKQFLTLADRPVLAHTLDLFYNHPQIDEIIVVAKDEELTYCRQEILDKYNFDGVKLVAGGETRRESVYAGLMAFSLAIDYVIIHDGARPLLLDITLNNIIKALATYDAVTTGLKVKDTIKTRDENGLIRKTLDRDRLVAIQTPQAFKYKLIVQAHQEVPVTEKVFDDASLVEGIGHPVNVVEGSYENIKITTPIDLIYAKSILENRREKNESGNWI